MDRKTMRDGAHRFTEGRFDGLIKSVWQLFGQNWLCDIVFDSYDASLDVGCNACNSLLVQPDTIISIVMRPWAHDGR